MLRWHERKEPWLQPEERALTPAEAVGVVLRESKRRGLPWHVARKLAMKALPWSPESSGRPPENDYVLADLMDWYEALVWAFPALRAAYLNTTAPSLAREDYEYDDEDFDPADFSRYVALSESAEPVPAGEWAPDGFELVDLDLD